MFTGSDRSAERNAWINHMRFAGKLLDALAASLKSEGKADVSLILAFVSVNLLVLIKCVLHDPRIGYDAFSVVGYLWFLIRYPSPNKGDTIKATYLLHIMPIVGICVGLLLEE
jgi:hypothetical protein